MLNDVGEALMRFLINRRAISGDRRFWQSLMPEQLGRDALAAAFRAVAGAMIQRSMKRLRIVDIAPVSLMHTKT